ncbi:MATE family efflux transporter [Candidatus Stoquefichus massiliensis]|uniref:MATE family efflux transporter n=1 Tax=Candidatus Stoquefichus massiliensis TaxID=1470350 RepID=UPI000484F470|nr:MATE family efflux transporter [Candidatus Stoquefichus massiliensis]
MKHQHQIKSICYLAWPAIVQEALNVVVTYVDTAMVGALGASASAAVGLTSTVGWLVSSVAVAFGVGVLSVCAQADGAHDTKRLKLAGQQAFFMTLIVGLALTVICLCISPYLPTWLNGDPSIHKDASAYFMIISLPLLLRSSVLILSSALRGVSDMKTPMMINLYMNLINIVLNFLLIYPSREIYGILIPGAGLGVIGAATATAISFSVGGILMFIRYYRNPIFDFIQTGFHYHASVFKDCLRIGLPVVLERSVICLGQVAFSSLIAKLGVIQFAAHTIAIQAEQAFYIPGYGFQSAAATMVGNAVGEQNEKKVKQVTYLICLLTFVLMLIAGIILFIFAENLMSLFTPDPQVIALGALVLRIVSVSEPIYGVLVILEGTFNGMGDTKAPFAYSLFTMWGIRVLGTWIMINVLHLSLAFVWIMMVCDNVARCFLLSRRFLQGKWIYRMNR